jgi:hypothetical protein
MRYSGRIEGHASAPPQRAIQSKTGYPASMARTRCWSALRFGNIIAAVLARSCGTSEAPACRSNELQERTRAGLNMILCLPEGIRTRSGDAAPSTRNHGEGRAAAKCDCPRVCRHSFDGLQGGREMDESGEAFICLVIACGDAPPFLEALDAVLDQMAPLVHLGVVGNGRFAILL